MKHTIVIGALGMALALPWTASSQNLRTNLNESGSEYLQFTWLNQVWLRANQSNPGTTVNGTLKSSTFDLGLRRTRMQIYGQVLPKTFVYMQLGMNNVNAVAAGNGGNRKNQFFVHDALLERKLSAQNQLKVGGGLTILNGLSRFSQPSIGTIAALDVPVFAQATVDQTDQFSRKLSLYARGQVGRLDYRAAVTTPYTYSTGGGSSNLGANASFNPYSATKQYQGFAVWNFAEREGHTTPYMQGCYLGSKRVLNLEAGWIRQAKATWSLQGGDTLNHPLNLWSVALFADQPYGSRKASITGYLGYFRTNYGPGYVRTNGLMNPANGTANGALSLGGYGNAYPMFATGSTWYGQVAWVSPDRGPDKPWRFQPYGAVRQLRADRLRAPMWVTNVGINLLEKGHTSKFSLDWATRPTYTSTGTDGLWEAGKRRHEVVLQYQVYLN
ncbi:MAG: hypothetical protein ACO31C_02600 [Schleiferiaceae bacterium]